MLDKDTKKHQSPKAPATNKAHNSPRESPDPQVTDATKDVVDIGYVTFFPAHDTTVAESS